MATAETAGTWTLLTGHGHVLVSIAKNPGARVRDIAVDAGLTERATQAIITDLEAAGYLTRSRVGRRTEYTIHPDQGFRHQNQEGLRIGPFLEVLASSMQGDGHTMPDEGRIQPVGVAAMPTGEEPTWEGSSYAEHPGLPATAADTDTTAPKDRPSG
jgi:hypothetical protein